MQPFEVERGSFGSLPADAARRESRMFFETDGSFAASKVRSMREESSEEVGNALFSAFTNTTNTILGAGTLAVPIAMSSAGFIAYILMTLVVIRVHSTTVNWLVMVADQLPKGVARNYEGITQEYLGTTAAHVISAVFIFGGLSLGMSRMMFTSRSLAPVLASWFCEEGQPSIKEIRALEFKLMWACGLFIVLPLGLLRDISKLRFASGLAIAALTFAAGFMVFCNVSDLATTKQMGPGVQWMNFESSFFLSLAMTTSNFSCHIAAMPIYESLGVQRTSQKMRWVVLAAMGTAAIVYQLVGLTSYARFGHLDSADGSNILEVVAEHINRKRSPAKFALVSVASAGMAISLVFGMPVVLWALRSVLLSYYRSARATQARWAGKALEQIQETQHAVPSFVEWAIVTTFIVFAILVLATAVPDIQVVMSFGGSLGGTFIAFMYPALFHLKVVKGVSLRDSLKRQNAAELGIIAMSIVYGVLCLSISINKIVRIYGASEEEPSESSLNTMSNVMVIIDD